MYKQKCKDLYEKCLRDYLTSDDESEQKKRMQKIFKSDSFAHIRDQPHAEEINNYVGEIVNDISRIVVEEKLDEVIGVIMCGVNQLIDDMFSEAEAEEVFNFAKTELGKKIIRNFDLFRDSHQEGGIMLISEIVSRWSRPEIAEEIADFIVELEEKDEQNGE